VPGTETLGLAALAGVVGLVFVSFGLFVGWIALVLFGRWYSHRFVDPTPVGSVRPGAGLVKVRGRATPPDRAVTDRRARASAEAPFSGRDTLLGGWIVKREQHDGADSTVRSGQIGGAFDVVGDTGRVRVGTDPTPSVEAYGAGGFSHTVTAGADPPERVARAAEELDVGLPGTGQVGPVTTSGSPLRFEEDTVGPGDEVQVVGRAVEGADGPTLTDGRPWDDFHVTDDPAADREKHSLPTVVFVATVGAFFAGMGLFPLSILLWPVRDATGPLGTVAAGACVAVLAVAGAWAIRRVVGRRSGSGTGVGAG
jgi:uncharacterized membrane protein YqjE